MWISSDQDIPNPLSRRGIQTTHKGNDGFVPHMARSATVSGYRGSASLLSRYPPNPHIPLPGSFAPTVMTEEQRVIYERDSITPPVSKKFQERYTSVTEPDILRTSLTPGVPQNRPSDPGFVISKDREFTDRSFVRRSPADPKYFSLLETTTGTGSLRMRNGGASGKKDFHVVYEDMPSVEGTQRSHLRKESYRPLLSKSRSPVPRPEDARRRILFGATPQSKASVNDTSSFSTALTRTLKNPVTPVSTGETRSFFTNRLGKTLMITTKPKEKSTPLGSSTSKYPTTTTNPSTSILSSTKLKDSKALNDSLRSKLLRLKEERTVMVKLNKALIEKLSVLNKVPKNVA